MPVANIALRPLSGGDVDAAARIETAAFSASRGKNLDEGWEARLRLDITNEVGNESDWGLVLEEGQTMIGVCHGGPYRDWSPEGVVPGVGKVTGLAVAPHLWGHGYGKALLTSALELMRERGFENARLWVEMNNSRAIGLFESFGFNRTGSLETDDDEKVVEYELHLRESNRVSN